jgi:CubicO group peptidase (beta-lactamase class C family)
MYRRDLLAQLGALGLVSVLPRAGWATPARPRIPRLAQGEEDLERLLRLANVPSLASAEVESDRLTTLAVGSARAGEAARVTADSVYAAASLTKTVFSYAFLDLALDGAISLDRPVHQYLPLPNPDDPRARAITARHLLSHSGGWRNWRNTTSQALTADFEPGTRWSYSGEGFFFLQRIAEQVTGHAVGTIVRERVLDPLGMTHSSMVRREDLEPLLVAGHNSRGEPVPPFGETVLAELRRAMAVAGKPLEAARVEDLEAAVRAAEPARPVLPNFMTVNAAASLLTSAGDFGRFLRHLVTARRQGGRPAAIVERMMTPLIRGNEAIEWGHGVGIETVAGVPRAWQWGDNAGFKHIYFADPAGERAIVVFTNGDRGARVYERVVRDRTGMDHPAFLFL